MATTSVTSDVKGFELADLGKKRIEWANQSMKVLQIIRKEFIKNQPLKGFRVSACLHITAETANLMRLAGRRRRRRLCASNPLSTQDDVAASLVRDYSIPVFAIKGEDSDTYYRTSWPPSITSRSSPWTTAPTWSPSSTPSARTRIGERDRRHRRDDHRRHSPARHGQGRRPAISPSSPSMTPTPSTFRQSLRHRTVDHRWHHPRHRLPVRRDRSSSSPVTAGAAAASLPAHAALGAEVIVTEIDPIKALEAVMDGFRVMSMEEAAKLGDVFCTVTGNKNVLAKQHFELMKDGAIISNSGHFNVEIDIPALEKMSSSKRTTRDFVEEYSLKDGRRINLLGEGRLINLAAAEGHPGIRDGYEFRRSGAGLRVHGEELFVAGKEGLHRSGGSRQARSQAETGVARHQDRPLDLRAGRISGELERRNINQLSVISCQFHEGRRKPPFFFLTTPDASAGGTVENTLALQRREPCPIKFFAALPMAHTRDGLWPLRLPKCF